MNGGYLWVAEGHKGQGTQLPWHDAQFLASRRALGNHDRLPNRGAGRFPSSHNGAEHKPVSESPILG